jgi:hypothetical protein
MRIHMNARSILKRLLIAGYCHHGWLTARIAAWCFKKFGLTSA